MSGLEVRVFLGGEGSNELGTRADQPMGDTPGVLEHLLRRVRSTGWNVGGALRRNHIRKYRAGAGALGLHNDTHNVKGLIAHAYQDHAEVLAFLRDIDNDPDREQAIIDGIAQIQGAFETEYRYTLAIVAGMPKPHLEGWLLALLGVRDTDEMSRVKAERTLAERGVELKRLDGYAQLVEQAALDTIPPCSLVAFLEQVRRVLDVAIDGH